VDIWVKPPWFQHRAAHPQTVSDDRRGKHWPFGEVGPKIGAFYPQRKRVWVGQSDPNPMINPLIGLEVLEIAELGCWPRTRMESLEQSFD
jgi:hypothetical protein